MAPRHSTALCLCLSFPLAALASYGWMAARRNWKQTADMAVDTRVCECCQTSAAVTADGVLTAFRNRTDKEIRDIHVSRLEDGKWTEPTPVHNDNWDIP